MSITKLFNRGHVIWQTPDNELDMPNEAIAVHVDPVGTICIHQEENCIVLNRATVPELYRLLKKLALEER